MIIIFLANIFIGLKHVASFQVSISVGTPSSNCAASGSSTRAHCCSSSSRSSVHFLHAKNNDDDEQEFTQHEDDDRDDDEEFNGLVTKEIFLRDMLADPTAKRKKRNGKSYRTLDNGENLPFVVKVMTPDPYTNAERKKDEAKRIAKQQRQAQQQKYKQGNNNSNKRIRRADLIGMDDTIAASIYSQNSDGTMGSVIGEFSLDKSTTSGDIISIGDVEYQVQRARCQYKYAGGKRFVMIRKILEVKAIVRAGTEMFLQHQFSKEMNKDDVPPAEL